MKHRIVPTTFLGIALTLSTLGSIGHEVRPTPTPTPAPAPQIRLAAAQPRPQSLPDGGGSAGYHAKGCPGAHTAQSRATTQPFTFRYSYSMGMPMATGLLRAAFIVHYTLCTHATDRIKIHVVKACITQLDGHPDHIYYQGTRIQGYIWEPYSGRGPGVPEITVPDDGDHQGETTCVRKRIPKHQTHWMLRYRPGTKHPAARFRFEGRVKIWLARLNAGQTDFMSTPRWIDPHRDHRLR